MHVRQMAELAALVAVHGPVLIRGPGRIASAAIEEYWLASKTRLDAWCRQLKQFASGRREAAEGPRLSPCAVIEEILASEVLTRTWTAALCAYDRGRGGEVDPIARTIYLGHVEARLRALNLLVHAPGVRIEQAVLLNRLRSRAERWSDLLIGRLLDQDDIAEFAPNPARAREFARDLRHESQQPGGQHAWPIVLGSLRAAFREALGDAAPHQELNDRVGRAVVGCFPAELFDSLGLFHSPWMLRLWQAAVDAEGMVAALAALDSPPAAAAGAMGHVAERRMLNDL